MPFVKLDTKILDSTLWLDRDLRDVFMTALLMAQPFEFIEPTPQLMVRELKETGWRVPAGWYGFLPAAGPAIIARARIPDVAVGLVALEQLGSPEPNSKSQEYEGRRLVRVDGGYVVLNFMRYRDHDYLAAGRMRKLRERRKLRGKPSADGVTANERNVTANDGVTLHKTKRQRSEYREQNLEKNGLTSFASDDATTPTTGSLSVGVDVPSKRSLRVVSSPSPVPTPPFPAENLQPISEQAVGSVVLTPPPSLPTGFEVQVATVVPAKVELISWSREACELWIARFQGSAPGGQIGKALKPLVGRYSWPEVKRAWISYLDQVEAQYASPERFSATYGRWSGLVADKPDVRRMSSAEKTMQVTRELIRKELEKKNAATKTGSVDGDRGFPLLGVGKDGD